jgi:hypothetical protein
MSDEPKKPNSPVFESGEKDPNEGTERNQCVWNGVFYNVGDVTCVNHREATCRNTGSFQYTGGPC